VSTLAAVCAYFNPCRYESRRHNYDIFRQRIEAADVTLLTVELVFDGHDSELGSYGNVLRIRGGDVMWQKERLLQIGIDRLLADGVDAIAWLDADLVFADDAWPQRTLAALDRFDCVQSFDKLVSHFADTRLVRPAAARDIRSYANGGSWAATGDFWRRVPLYQHCILGGADGVMAHAFTQFDNYEAMCFQWPESDHVLRHFNAAMRRHVATWANQVWGPYRVGFVANQTAHLLAHGARRDRQYVERCRLLDDYHPHADVVISPSGAFRWSCDKPLLRDSVAAYFATRCEDGPPTLRADGQ
jgi:hypothetical protein